MKQKTQSKTSSNEASLVVKCVYGQKACLIPGDATKATIEYISSNGGDLLAHVVIASHHGADECNSSVLISLANPIFVVYSAGKWKNYGHPRIEAVERYLSHPNNRLAQSTWHTISAGAIKERRATTEPYAITVDDYGLLAINRGLYCTLIQGDIKFKWGQGNNNLEAPHTTRGDSLGNNKKLHILKALAGTDNEGGDFMLQNGSSVLLQNLQIDETDKTEMKAICKVLVNSPSILHVNLNNNRLKFALERLTRILRENPRVLTFMIQNNQLTEQDKAILIAAWNNRGLSL